MDAIVPAEGALLLGPFPGPGRLRDALRARGHDPVHQTTDPAKAALRLAARGSGAEGDGHTRATSGRATG